MQAALGVDGGVFVGIVIGVSGQGFDQCRFSFSALGNQQRGPASQADYAAVDEGESGRVLDYMLIDGLLEQNDGFIGARVFIEVEQRIVRARGLAWHAREHVALHQSRPFLGSRKRQAQAEQFDGEAVQGYRSYSIANTHTEPPSGTSG